MQRRSSYLGGRVINEQSREIVANVITYLTDRFPEENVVSITSEAAKATGVSLSTIYRIAAEKKKIDSGECAKYRSPKKHIYIPKRITAIDDTDKAILKQVILNFHETEKTVPTLERVLLKFKDATGFKGSGESLRKIIQRIGFEWRKKRSNRKVLMESHNSRFQRTSYLRDIRKFRQDKRPIVYVGQTHLNASQTTAKSCSGNNSSEELREPIGNGERMIIVNAGNENGFVPHSSFIFQSSTKTGNYHSETNFTNYTKWLQEKLIPNLSPDTVLVMDSVPYRSEEEDECPTIAFRRQEMKEWLQRKDIPFKNTLSKSELYRLILSNKPVCRTDIIDNILIQHQQTVLRLPLYHLDLNPIELVWASLKECMVKNNVPFQLANIKELCEEFFRDFPVTEWTKCCAHARKCEEDYLMRKRNTNAVVDKAMNDLKDDFSDNDSSDHSDEFSFDCD